MNSVSLLLKKLCLYSQRVQIVKCTSSCQIKKNVSTIENRCERIQTEIHIPRMSLNLNDVL